MEEDNPEEMLVVLIFLIALLLLFLRLIT